MAGGNRLQVADFFPSLLMTPGSAKTNFFLLFSYLGLIMAQQTNIHVNCFMMGDVTPCAVLSQNAHCGRETW